MKNIHVLPTDKTSKLYVRNDVTPPFYSNFQGDAVNIYITSDEEIKEGDWILDLEDSTIGKVKDAKDKHNIEIVYANQGVGLSCNVKDCSEAIKYPIVKLILTTDQDLIKDGVQAIDEEFLEWFVKNPSCETVKVGIGFSNEDDITDISTDYEIIIPKVVHQNKGFGGGLHNITCQCMRPSPGDFTANCRNCGFRIKDRFDHSLDSLKQAIENKYPEQPKQDCEPESIEEEFLQKIKFVLLAGNDAQAIRLLEQYGAYMQEQALASKGRS